MPYGLSNMHRPIANKLIDMANITMDIIKLIS